MSIPLAVLSHGLFVTGSGDFPIPFDVRYGVDNGEGELGTLTSPAPNNVRRGVQYGGDGNQYIGTLYVRSAGATTWTEDALELWNDQVLEYGTTMEYDAWTFPCIKNPINSMFAMTQTGYDQQADTTIDMLRSDAVTSGLYALVQSNPQTKRPIVTIEGIRFTVLRLENDDSAQPSIRLSSVALK